MIYRLLHLSLQFPDDFPVKVFHSEHNQGISFDLPPLRYEIISSPLGIRLLINGAEGEMRDLPFHPGTFHFLPDFIEVSIQ